MSPMLFVTSNPSCPAVLPKPVLDPACGLSVWAIGRRTLMTGSSGDLPDPTPRNLDAASGPVKRIIRKFRKASCGLAESCQRPAHLPNAPREAGAPSPFRRPAPRFAPALSGQKISPGAKPRFCARKAASPPRFNGQFHDRRKETCISRQASVYTRLTAVGDTRFPLRDAVAAKPDHQDRMQGSPERPQGLWVYSSVGRAADS